MKAAPHFRQVVNLWSLRDYPPRRKEWSLERKLRAVKEAGFDGIAELGSPELGRLAGKYGLYVVGYFASGNAGEFRRLLMQNKEAGASHINVQLGDHDTPTADALNLALKLIEEGRKLELQPAIEVHRDTCTETPEKLYALADAYEAETREVIPLTWDFSHLAVVKHLAPSSFVERLLVRPELIQRATQFHLRPFNGHHCQVPATDGGGRASREVKDWLPFAKALFELWLAAKGQREIIVVPEMGPASSGYNLYQLPNSWDDAQVLRPLIASRWQEALKAAGVKSAPLGSTGRSH